MNAQKERHIQELQQMGLKSSFRWLRTLENRAHWQAERYYSESDYTSSKMAADHAAIKRAVKQAFGGTLPNGFFINSDPRGYALKIDDSVNTLSAKDWGGYGLLAPDFTE